MAPRESPVFELIRRTDEKHDAGHTRLRHDWREHEERLLKLEAVTAEQGYQIKMLANTSPDFSKLALSPGIVITIVVAIITVVAGQVGSTWGMRSDIRDLVTQLTSVQKVQDERDATLRNAVEDIKKKQELQQLEMQNLRETVLNQRQQPR